LLESFGGLPEVLADITAKKMAPVPLVGVFFAQIIQWTCRMFTSTKYGKRVSTETGKAYPLGYFMVVTKKSLAK
jgi:hypothetical protein